MRKFKKALVLSLACAMGLSLVACGGNDDATTEAKKDDTTTEAAKEDASDATSEAEVSGSDEGKVHLTSTLGTRSSSQDLQLTIQDMKRLMELMVRSVMLMLIG